VKALVAGSGVIGPECVRPLAAEGWHVLGVDNDLRRELFGPMGSTEGTARIPIAEVPGCHQIRRRYPRPSTSSATVIVVETVAKEIEIDLCCFLFLSPPKMLAHPGGRRLSLRRANVQGRSLPHWPVFRCQRLAGFGVHRGSRTDVPFIRQQTRSVVTAPADNAAY
jgi:hypothetical protein